MLVSIIILAGLAWRYGPLLQQLLSDRARIQAFAETLGWFGPILLIFFNAVQIIVAPIPGYIVQLAAGYLYGPWWGGLWGAIGLYIGSMSAMWLARTFGRPLVERAIGVERVEHFEHVIHSDSIYVWFVLLLGPTGDAPYYLAGLSQIRFAQILLITTLLRVPSAFVAAAIGAGAFALTWWQFTLIVATVGLIALILIRHKAFLSAWVERVTQAMGLSVPPTVSDNEC
ncbi:MAG: TVP38/TMEM64 family protein [Caldilineaceae bacterium]|nr:TVP38/TMEM64 family protein [Caldilineaceae bacterium]